MQIHSIYLYLSIYVYKSDFIGSKEHHDPAYARSDVQQPRVVMADYEAGYFIQKKRSRCRISRGHAIEKKMPYLKLWRGRLCI